MISIYFFLEIEVATTKMVNSKSLKKICCQLLSTMNVLNGLLTVSNCTSNLKNFFPYKMYGFANEVQVEFHFRLRGLLGDFLLFEENGYLMKEKLKLELCLFLY